MKLITRVVLLAAALVLPGMASAGTYVSVTVAPPPLPVYAQPVCPGDGYLWTPGYWAWDGDQYYWVPGVWVLAPAVNVFWTPGYWGWASGYYRWHGGYWGPRVGFYGGVNYGYGYGGVGYAGGRWERGAFHYNRAVNNINIVNVHNTYNTTVINRNNNRVSFNGGEHGIRARPTARERAAANDNHIRPTSVQEQHVRSARDDRPARFSQNREKPVGAPAPRQFSSGHERSMRAPDVSSRPAPGRMSSSDFAPHAGRERGDAPRAPQVDRPGNDRGVMPSSSYGPREHQRNEGRMPPAMRQDSPRAANPRAMNGPAHQRMGGGEMHRNEGQRPQGGHRREER